MGRFSKIKVPLFLLLLFTATGVGGYLWAHREVPVAYQTQYEADPYVRFSMEAYDKIKEHYWNKFTEAQLGEWFRLSLQTVTNTNPTLASTTRESVAEMLSLAFEATSTDARKQLATSIV